MEYLEEIIYNGRAYHTQPEKSDLSCEGCVFHKLVSDGLYGCFAPVGELDWCKAKRVVFR